MSARSPCPRAGSKVTWHPLNHYPSLKRNIEKALPRSQSQSHSPEPQNEGSTTLDLTERMGPRLDTKDQDVGAGMGSAESSEVGLEVGPEVDSEVSSEVSTEVDTEGSDVDPGMGS